MQQESFLLATAQIAVTLAGFSGLVLAIRGAPPARWQARDMWSLAWMLGTSLSPMFLALLPLVLASFAIDAALLWRAATLVMSAWMVVFALAMAVSGGHLTRSGYRARVRYFPTVATCLTGGVGLLVGLAGIGVLPEARAGLFALGLVTCLLVSALSLVVFLAILSRTSASESHPKDIGTEPAHSQR